MNDPQPLSPARPEDAADPSSLTQNRKQKLLEIKSSGIDPYPARSPLTLGRSATDFIKKKYASIQAGEESPELLRLCGRMMTRRDMGKASFAHLQDFQGQLQIYLRKDVLGEKTFELFSKNIDLGDLVAVEGKAFRTKTGELSLRCQTLELLSKSLKPLPEKWHGLKDIEIRSRQRELDLIANASSRKVFEARTKVIQSLRNTLARSGFIEVETPMMQPVAGGAVARPFETFHNALDQKFYLRVAPELYLKRCLVGGFEKVFEIGRVFRNEGIDSLHNPEFTILEAYESYGDMESMIRLAEELMTDAANSAAPSFMKDIQKPFKRASIYELFEKWVGKEEAQSVAEENWAELTAFAYGSKETPFPHKTLDHLFDEKIKPHLQEPTFVTDFPASLSPLAKCRAGNPHVAERFELYMDGEEIANAYSELNDPIEQKNRLQEYRKSRSKIKEEEGMGLDEGFLTALEYGMPPAGGLGIGVDRLVMILTGQTSIRDVLLFPTLKTEK